MSGKNRIYIIIVLLVLLVAVISPVRKFVSDMLQYVAEPIQKEFAESSISSNKFFSGIRDFISLKSQNEELSKKIKQFSIERSKLKELEMENENLKKQLGFVEQQKELSLIPAKIIGREPISFLDYILVDKGRDDGIELGRAVVSDGVLIGKVTEVNNKQSEITLITSKDSIIQAMLQQSRVQGVLRGGLSGLTLDNVPQDVQIMANENVITSGLGGDVIFGLLIGEVVSQQSSKAEIFKSLNVRSLVDFSKLELVFIIK